MLPRYGMGSFTSLSDGVNECLPRGWCCLMFLSKIMMNLKRFLLGRCMMPSYPDWKQLSEGSGEMPGTIASLQAD